MREPNILDEIQAYTDRFVIYPNQHARAVHTLWILGSYFLEYEDIPVFDNYPLLAFLSPVEDSGKSRALEVTEVISYNSLSSGDWTPAALCGEIRKKYPTLITMCLDEADETFAIGKDTSAYIKLLNNGYQRGKYIVRRSTKGEDNVHTPAYCAKAIAGLTAARFKRTTRSRMIQIFMRPSRDNEKPGRHIDKQTGQLIVSKIIGQRDAIADKVRNVDEDTLSNLPRRAGQIWHPLLAIAKVIDDEWFRRVSEAAIYFVDKHKAVPNNQMRVFLELYRCYDSGKYRNGIWTKTFATVLQQERGFEPFFDKFKIAYYLGSEGIGLTTRELRLGNEKSNAYMWDNSLPFFADFITEEMRNQIHKENHIHSVDFVEAVEAQKCVTNEPTASLSPQGV